MARRRNPETDLMKAMLDLLHVRGCQARRRNVAGKRPFVGTNGKTYWVQCGTSGEADLSGTLPDGRRIEVEVKVPGNRPTPEQFAYLREVESYGAAAFWSDSLEHLDLLIGHLLRGARTRIADDGCIDIVYPYQEDRP